MGHVILVMLSLFINQELLHILLIQEEINLFLHLLLIYLYCCFDNLKLSLNQQDQLTIIYRISFVLTLKF
jgi:hypothetical protein